MKLFTVILFLSLNRLIQEASCNCHRLRKALDDFSAHSYDEIHQLAVLDQVDDYIKPIKSSETRNFKALNGLYDFCFDSTGQGFRAKWFEKPLVDTCLAGNYHRMPVPSAFNDILSDKTAKNYVGWMWYQTSMFWRPQNMPIVWNGHQRQQQTVDGMTDWILQIDSINYLSIIWLQIIHDDGKMESHLAGSHVGGHLPITMNVSSILNKIDTTYAQIRLTIAVSNLLTPNTIPSGQMVNMTDYVGRPYFRFQPDFDFFNFAGIMGDVRLIELPRYHIEDVEVLRKGGQHRNDGIQVRVCLNEPVWGDYFIVHHSLAGTGRNMTIDRWSPQPRLDDDDVRPSNCSTNDLDACRPFVKEKEKCQLLSLCHDELSCQTKFGTNEWLPIKPTSPTIIRFSLHKDAYYLTQQQMASFAPEQDSFELRLIRRPHGNILDQLLSPSSPSDSSNTPRQLQGFGMHHEQLFSGRTMSLSSIMKDLYLLKEMGANIIRTSHYPYSRAYLEACDELGLMVIAECPAVGLGTFNSVKLILHKQILLEMMQRDHGHPSIVMWSLANEPQSQLVESRAYFESLVHYARNDLRQFTIDANRPISAALAQSHNDDKIGDLFDVLMINRYYGWYECTGVLECISYSLVKSLTGWSDKYGHNKPLLLSEFGADTLAGLHSGTDEIFSEEFQRDLIIEYERVFDQLVVNRTANSMDRRRINFLGAMIWNFADFSTHESLLRVGGNKKGIFTKAREPKLAAGIVKQIYHSRLT
uniref:Beta-glucuronidase n=1 Tax=Aceria tosichella TaxID=561515 RepID=A0A6G1S4K0_9ACAR